MAGQSEYNNGVADSGANNISAYNTSEHDISAYTTSAFDTSVFNISVYNISANNNSAYNPSAYDDGKKKTLIVVTSSIILVLSLAAFFYGLISWCLLKKFRNVRNFVLVHLMLTSGFRYCPFLFSDLYCLYFYHNSPTLPCLETFTFIYVFWGLAFNCWLLVLSYIFYVDFVKVFNLNIRRRYLKSGMFGWGVPSTTVFLYVLFRWLLITYFSIDILIIEVVTSLVLLPVAINLVIYFTVVYSLFHSSELGVTVSTKKWRRFYIATLIFVLSNL